jgi:hypothetical protein
VGDVVATRITVAHQMCITIAKCGNYSKFFIFPSKTIRGETALLEFSGCQQISAALLATATGEASAAPLFYLLITMEDEARNVDVSYKINCISHIDSVTSTYYVDVKLFLHWIDPNFIGRKKNQTIDIKAEGSWNPDIIVTNEHELSSVEAHREVKVNDPVKGEVKSSIQYRGTLFINVSITVVYLWTRLLNYSICAEYGPCNVPGRLPEPSNLLETVQTRGGESPIASAQRGVCN